MLPFQRGCWFQDQTGGQERLTLVSSDPADVTCAASLILPEAQRQLTVVAAAFLCSAAPGPPQTDGTPGFPTGARPQVKPNTPQQTAYRAKQPKQSHTHTGTPDRQMDKKKSLLVTAALLKA